MGPTQGGLSKQICVQVKDQSELDCYSRQLDLLQIGGIQKATAVKLMNGINIEQTADGAPAGRVIAGGGGGGGEGGVKLLCGPALDPPVDTCCALVGEGAFALAGCCEACL